MTRLSEKCLRLRFPYLECSSIYDELPRCLFYRPCTRQVHFSKFYCWTLITGILNRFYYRTIVLFVELQSRNSHWFCIVIFFQFNIPTHVLIFSMKNSDEAEWPFPMSKHFSSLYSEWDCLKLWSILYGVH